MTKALDVMLNEWDERKVKRAILALENSPCENTELAKWIYTVAFSTSIGLDGTPSDVLDLVFNSQFEKVKQLAIIRPIMKDTTAVTPEAAAYAGDMNGIVAEKLSSHVKGNTANLGDVITYTVSLFNTNDKEVTFPVEFTVPEFTTLVSGELSASVTVGAGEKTEFLEGLLSVQNYFGIIRPSLKF